MDQRWHNLLLRTGTQLPMDCKTMILLSILLALSILLNIATIMAWRGADRDRELYRRRWKHLCRRNAREFLRASKRNLLKVYSGRN